MSARCLLILACLASGAQAAAVEAAGLDEAVGTAYAADPALQSAESEAAGRLAQASAGWRLADPDLRAGTAWPVTAGDDVGQQFIELRWEPPHPWTEPARIRLAKSRLALAEVRIAVLRWNLRRAVNRDWFALVQARLEVDEARQLADLEQERALLFGRLGHLGERAAVEVSEARDAATLAGLQLGQRSLALAAAEAALAARGVVVARAEAPPVPTELLALDRALAQALRQRPDLAAIRRALAETDTDLTLEQRRRIPWFNHVAVERRFRDDQDNGDSWQVVVGMNLPLGGADPGQRQGAAAAAAAWRRALPVAVDRVRAEVTALLAQVVVARSGADFAATAQRDLAAEASPSSEADPAQALALRRIRIRLAAQAVQADLRWRATVVALQDALALESRSERWSFAGEGATP